MSWNSFEDIKAWQDAGILVREVYAVTATGAWSRDYGLRDQIRRTAVSVMNNIAEGFARGSQAEFRRFLDFSRGSCAEVQSLLYVALDIGYLELSDFQRLRLMTTAPAAKIAGLAQAISSRLEEPLTVYDD